VSPLSRWFTPPGPAYSTVILTLILRDVLSAPTAVTVMVLVPGAAFPEAFELAALPPPHAVSPIAVASSKNIVIMSCVLALLPCRQGKATPGQISWTTLFRKML